MGRGETPMYKNPVQVPDKWKWFVNDRLGLFIHWGLYALPARHEWVKHKERITDADYQKYFENFNPDLYDPKAWAKAAKNAGMKYFVITTKHHEGFCLFDSKHTDYKAPNTPCGKDLIKPMVDAFRAEGIKVGFYHSLIDWHHPDFGVDHIHPQRDNAEERAKNSQRDIKKYTKYLHDQVRELLTNYGKIDYLFFDFSYPGEDGKGHEDWGSEELIKLCRELQPDIIIDDRLDLEDYPGGWDIKTPEQFMMAKWPTKNGKPVLWETCQTFSGSWGYYRDEETWKSVEQLLFLLIDTVSKGGNLLLNVGPTARGEFDYRALDSLAGMGEWMKRHSRSIYGCTQAPEEFPTPDSTRLTYNPETNRLYVHLLHWPIEIVNLPGFAGKVKYAQLLNDASEIHFQEPPSHWGMDSTHDPSALTLRIPVKKPNVAIPVIELFLK
jgi:alpha-L-fucosidase